MLSLFGDQVREAALEVESRVDGDDVPNDLRVDVSVAMAADVEAGGVPEKVRLRPVLERDLDGDMKPNRLRQRLLPFERPT